MSGDREFAQGFNMAAAIRIAGESVVFKEQRDELASLLTLIKIGLESGTVESKPILDMSDEEATSIEPVSLLSLINKALAKLDTGTDVDPVKDE